LADLLNANPEYGDIRLLVQRQPDFFAHRNLLGKSAAVIGRSPQGKAMFLCELREYPVYLGGKIVRAVCLGMLRTDGDFRQRIGILEHGFLALRKFARHLGFADEFFTVASHDNVPLRIVLEAGLSRLPRHIRLGNALSLLLPLGGRQAGLEVPAHYTLNTAVPSDAIELERLLAASGSGWSYAPAPGAAQLAALLADGEKSRNAFDMLILRHKGLAVGCAGIWDQRGQRQLLVKSYSLGTSLMRIMRTLASRDAQALPAPGNRLELVFLPFFSIRHNHADAGKVMLHRAILHAGTLGGKICALCLSGQNPLSRELGGKGIIRRIGVYRIVFQDRSAASEGRLFDPQPELALL
jgi:hypothetical protein